MSQPATAYPDLDPWNGMLYSVAERLLPLFVGAGRGETYARLAAGEAIASFHPETRADYANIGRILALSLATITAAVQAGTPDLPAPVRLRFLSQLQGLSKAADQAERTMTLRRRCAREKGSAGDNFVRRPPDKPSRYAPLPPDDPASGAAFAALKAEQALAGQQQAGQQQAGGHQAGSPPGKFHPEATAPSSPARTTAPGASSQAPNPPQAPPVSRGSAQGASSLGLRLPPDLEAMLARIGFPNPQGPNPQGPNPQGPNHQGPNPDPVGPMSSEADRCARSMRQSLLNGAAMPAPGGRTSPNRE